MADMQQLDPSTLDPEQGLGDHRKLSRTSSAISNPADFSIQWKNLTYIIDKPGSSLFFHDGKSKTILSGLNGQLGSGQLMALMGPSGAGKSTLLECIASIRRKGRFGEVLFVGQKKVNMAFIPQKDNFLQELTVREALTFASKFQNSAIRPDGEDFDDIVEEAATENFHVNVVQEIVTKLGLDICADVRIANCSGGQLKRLSIAQELVSKPHILILDEPTSGLDSSSCYQTVDLLHQLTQEKPPMAIMVTIHQPPAKVFNLFHKVYTLSSTGKCIYEGEPGDSLVTALRSFQLSVPQFTNPADFLIDVAAGDHGRKIIAAMSVEHERSTRDTLLDVAKSDKSKSIAFLERDLDDMILKFQYPFFRHLGLHYKRSFICSKRNPTLNITSLAMHVLSAIFLGFLYSGRGIGSIPGCPPPLKDTTDPAKFEAVQERMEEQSKLVFFNLGFWFFSLMLIQFAALMTTVLTFPLDVAIVAKERTNGWYSIVSYYLGKTLADIPLQMTGPLIYLAIVYLATQQPLEWQRFVLVVIPFLCMALVSQSQGVVVGGLFAKDLVTVVFMAPVTVMPMMMFSGFFIELQYIPYLLSPFTYLSYSRFAFESVALAIYGFNRCGEDTVEIVATINQRLSMFLSNVFRIAFTGSDDDDYPDEKYQMSVKNMTSSMSNGIVNQLAGKIEVVDGQQVAGVLAELFIVESYYVQHIISLGICFLLLRALGFYITYTKANVTK